MIMSNIEISCYNVTANLNCELNLSYISKNILNVKLQTNHFYRIVIRNLNTTCLVYKTGKIICLGGKSLEQSKNSIKHTADIIKNLGYNIRLSEFNVRNIQGIYKYYTQISLENLILFISERVKNEIDIYIGKRTSLELELFPHLHISYKNSIRIIVYRKGTISLTGSNTIEGLEEALDWFTNVLMDFQSL